MVTGEEYSKWSNWYYGNVCTYPWMDEIEEDDFIVLDVYAVDVGLMGSSCSFIQESVSAWIIYIRKILCFYRVMLL